MTNAALIDAGASFGLGEIHWNDDWRWPHFGSMLCDELCHAFPDIWGALLPDMRDVFLANGSFEVDM
jgi:hypothetical protein